MRILHILNHTERLNGHVHACVDLASAQAQMGHDVAVASGYGTFDALLRQHGVEVIRLDQRRTAPVLLQAEVALLRLLKRRRFEVVHAHMVTSALLAWPSCLATGIPLVTTVHNEFQRSAVLMGVGARVIAVSEAVRTSMQSRGVAGTRLRVVLNGTIGSARFAQDCAGPVDLGHPSLLFVGGLHPRKGLPDLFQAFEIVHRAHPAARLSIVGEGPCRDEYQRLVSGLACADAVAFLGGRDDPRPYMRGADIFVLPSLKDPAPLVISEAREAGCAIIASDVDGIPELLERGEAGILVPPRNPERLAAAIMPLVEDASMLARWRMASQHGIGRLTVQRVAADVLALYAEVIAERSSAKRPAARVALAPRESDTPVES